MLLPIILSFIMKQKADFTLIQEKNLSSWKEFVDYCSEIQEGKYLFRGQSNYSNELSRGGNNENFKRWELQSSFDRIYPKSAHDFSNFISSIIGSFNTYFKRYDQIFNEPKLSEDLAKANASEKLKFFQHYGIPTCLIDFTFDPLTALYFAVSDIKYESGGQTDEFPNCYFSIFHINHSLLHEKIGVKYLNNSIEENSFLEFFHYNNFGKCINHKNDNLKYFYSSWIDIPDNYPFKWNENIKLQKGCFLLFESEPYLDTKKKWDTKKRSFEWMLQHFESITGEKSKEPILTIYNIPYKSIFANDVREGYNGSLYEFMKKNKKLGRYLFNDIQGLKYDIQFRLSVM
jgi:hypothetical protein